MDELRDAIVGAIGTQYEVRHLVGRIRAVCRDLEVELEAVRDVDAILATRKVVTSSD